MATDNLRYQPFVLRSLETVLTELNYIDFENLHLLYEAGFDVPK